jgi:fluoride ion exporter CrcB/FEX
MVNSRFNTLVVNLVGCFLLAAILTLALEVLEISSDLRLGVSTGFIGAFTTFSTLCKEILIMASQGYYLTAFALPLTFDCYWFCGYLFGLWYRMENNLPSEGQNY